MQGWCKPASEAAVNALKRRRRVVFLCRTIPKSRYQSRRNPPSVVAVCGVVCVACGREPVRPQRPLWAVKSLRYKVKITDKAYTKRRKSERARVKPKPPNPVAPRHQHHVIRAPTAAFDTRVVDRLAKCVDSSLLRIFLAASALGAHRLRVKGCVAPTHAPTANHRKEQCRTPHSSHSSQRGAVGPDGLREAHVLEPAVSICVPYLVISLSAL